MQKLGRNDPCHCGSGKKYKKCCMEKDELSNVTHIVPLASSDADADAGTAWGVDDEGEWEHGLDGIDPEEVLAMIDDNLPWSNELYRGLAHLLMNRMAGRHEWSVIAQAVAVLHAYTSSEQPITKKPGVLPAAAEYCVAALIHGYNVTQAELADIYDVSVATISKKAQEMVEFVEEHMGEYTRSLELEHTDHSPLNIIERDRMKLESSMRRMANTLSDFDGDLAGANHPGRKQALLLLEQAWQQSHQIKRIELARKALELYPDAADAYNILAETEARTLERIAEQYRRGIMAGQRDLGEGYIKENRGHFWGLIETRPYMRAKAGYAEACMYSGKFKEAIRQYEEILELNPNDNQGARDMLSAAYLERKQYREAEALLERFGEDSSSVRYDRVLIEYGLNGITDKLGSLFQAAKSSNSNVIPYLTGKKPAPDYVPDFIRPGDDSEAQDYVVTRIEAWTRESKLIRWLASKV